MTNQLEKCVTDVLRLWEYYRWDKLASNDFEITFGKSTIFIQCTKKDAYAEVTKNSVHVVGDWFNPIKLLGDVINQYGVLTYTTPTKWYYVTLS